MTRPADDFMPADDFIALLDADPAYRESMIDQVYPEFGEDQEKRQWAATAWMFAAAVDHLAESTQDADRREELREWAGELWAKAAAAGELRS